MIRSSILASAALLALSASAGAADLAPAAQEPEAPVVLPFSWTGFYVGAHAGSLTQGGSLKLSPFTTEAPADRTNGSDLDKTGFFGGALAGYNYQINSAVIGIEGDVGFGDAKSKVESDKTWAAVDGPNGLSGYNRWHAFNTLSQKVDGHVRLRIGWAFDRLLVYAAGGVAITDAKLGVLAYCNDSAPDPAGLVLYSGHASKTLVGFTIGGGVEYAITDHIIARAEYLFDDYGKKTFAVPPTGEWQDRKANLMAHTFRLAISYKF